VFRNVYLVLRHDPGRRLLILTRTGEPYASIEAMRESFLKLDESISYVSRPRTVLLVDSRQAPARNDPAFEAEFARLRKHLLRDLQKTATVVLTAVGILQANRHVRGDELPMGIFTDMGEALAYLGVTIDPARIELCD
jgi:hypothetical protein